MKISLFVLMLVMFAGCATVESDTRLFAEGVSASSLGYELGMDFSAEQRVRSGNIMALGKGTYSPGVKKGANDGYQYGLHVGGRYYFGGFFSGCGFYWSGYKMEFDNGRTWEKDTGNYELSAGWDKGPLEIVLSGSPEEADTLNRVSYLGTRIEYNLNDYWIIALGLKRVEFNQGGNREKGFMGAAGIGFEF